MISPSVQQDFITTVWSALKPYAFALSVPMAGISLLIGGIKIIVHPFVKELGSRSAATIYRISALIFGILWLWIWPMIQSYLPSIGIGNETWKILSLPAPLILVGGLAYGLFNIVLYDKLVMPVYTRFFDRRKK